MALDPKQLGDKLIEEGLLNTEELSRLLDHAKRQKSTLEQILFETEKIPDEKLGRIIAELYQVPFVKLASKNISEKLLPILPYPVASYQYALPFEMDELGVKVALNDPNNLELINFIQSKTGLPVSAHYATKKDIKGALKVYNKDINQKFNKLLKGVLDDPNKIESLNDASKIVDNIILFAYQNGASDIHLEPHRDFLVVRYRIDGILSTIAELPLSIAELLTTRIKVLAKLRTDEHRAAQDGRVKIELENNEITLRVSIVPTYDGEKTVMRILSSTNQELNLEALGYSPQNLKVIKSNMLKSHGIILMTGPTGSGKTTTLYTLLKMLNSPEVNISTIEDPIEYRLEGINQIQANPKANLTFANGLRALLRQDPDVIMVGEIRDEETAGVAINAALTGHLVFATVHTNNAASTLSRLIEMNVESFLVAATAELIIAQRLVRSICSQCKGEYELSAEYVAELSEKYQLKDDLAVQLQNLKEDPSEAKITLYRGAGCERCNGTGYKGRTSITEAMDISESLKDMILKNATPNELESKASSEGMITMFNDGLMKCLQGKTTLEEVLRVMRA